MTESFTPTWMLDAIYHLTPEQLKDQGIKAILTDLDNTLIAWNNPDGTAELHDWLDQMQAAGIPVMIVSNNTADRVDRVAKPLGLPFVSRAYKPGTKGLHEALKELNLKPEEAVMVGDQYLTDVFGANRAGIPSILVKPLIETDQWNTKINRFVEKGVRRRVMKKHPELTWRNSID
ncbi:HAD superfamily phosphatase (TIGR01668 family) [Weissella uvarum]|uniref:YqeG family HAD IIIA-type phosphatase n=1 Tax=Weissella uvarum TaxID=1479233 RepID=UPI0019613999|nr:YqeG family HAD IIIA-type phosphatase [Weissella uvarum]MBM7616495.1 HAD superfamily phosphatase (TIGR01668 family) [Weissella uvarum]MCM0595044.1 YqeG family HAD IIIA-type phosphatase [Weissella uvarum]